MSRHRLKIVIVIVACASLANPVLAGWNDSSAAAFAVPDAATVPAEASCPLADDAERRGADHE